MCIVCSRGQQLPYSVCISSSSPGLVKSTRTRLWTILPQPECCTECALCREEEGGASDLIPGDILGSFLSMKVRSLSITIPRMLMVMKLLNSSTSTSTAGLRVLFGAKLLAWPVASRVPRRRKERKKINSPLSLECSISQVSFHCTQLILSISVYILISLYTVYLSLFIETCL